MYLSFILYETTKTGCFLPEGKWWVEGKILITFSAIVGTWVSLFPCGVRWRKSSLHLELLWQSPGCYSSSCPASAQQLIDNDRTYSHLKDEVLNFLNFLTEFSTMRIPLERHRWRIRRCNAKCWQRALFQCVLYGKSQLQWTQAGEFFSGVYQ